MPSCSCLLAKGQALPGQAWPWSAHHGSAIPSAAHAPHMPCICQRHTSLLPRARLSRVKPPRPWRPCIRVPRAHTSAASQLNDTGRADTLAPWSQGGNQSIRIESTPRSQLASTGSAVEQRNPRGKAHDSLRRPPPVPPSRLGRLVRSCRCRRGGRRGSCRSEPAAAVGLMVG